MILATYLEVDILLEFVAKASFLAFLVVVNIVRMLPQNNCSSVHHI